MLKQRVNPYFSGQKGIINLSDFNSDKSVSVRTDQSVKRQCKKVTLIWILMLFWVINLFSQAPPTLWTKTIGGTSDDTGYSVQEISDGGYIIAGYTKSFGHGWYDVYLIKTDLDGDTLWTKTYGGVGYDAGHSVQETSDDGYIIVGETFTFGAGSSDVYLIKTDADGDTLWTKTYGGTINDAGMSVEQTSDEGFIITGHTRSFGGGAWYDLYLIKTDVNGDTLWTKTYGDGGDYYDGGYSVQETRDNGYIVAGWTVTPLGKYYHWDVYLVKTDADGDTLWTKKYGGIDDDKGHSVYQTSDRGYIIAGQTESFGAGSRDVYLIKTDANGDTLWTRTYGGTNQDAGLSVQETTDGKYIVAGYTKSFGAGGYDAYLIKTDVYGNILWTETYGGSYWDEGQAVQQTSDGGYIIVGYASSFGAGLWDVYLIKTDPEPVGIDEQEPSQNLDIISQCEPNPFRDKTLIKYTMLKDSHLQVVIYNLLGQKVRTLISENQSAGHHSVIWDGTDDDGNAVSSGIYFYCLTSNKITKIRKAILIR